MAQRFQRCAHHEKVYDRSFILKIIGQQEKERTEDPDKIYFKAEYLWGTGYGREKKLL